MSLALSFLLSPRQWYYFPKQFKLQEMKYVTLMATSFSEVSNIMWCQVWVLVVVPAQATLYTVPAPGRYVVSLRNPSDRGSPRWQPQLNARREQQSRIPPLYSSVSIPPLPVLNQPNGGLKRTEVSWQLVKVRPKLNSGLSTRDGDLVTATSS